MTPTITREHIKKNIDSNVIMTIIEALPKKYFESGHLPGALNIPHDEMRQKAPEMLEDTNAFIVVYCASAECQNSKIAMNTLQQMGYSNAYEYVEGKNHWLEAGFPVDSIE
ncbi:MAG: rhodanese-like domain-containing protein [Gammaproteobacteria bacterium]|nr:rhodanese-like domain-containing protein [Gammaproteobacteria bacterium]